MKGKHSLILIVSLFVGVSVLLSGCVSQNSFNEATNQVESLKLENSNISKENESLKSEKANLSAEVAKLKAELDEIKNGATNLLYQAKQLYENKKYDEVIKITSTLHQKFNGSAEDVEAQRLSANSQKAIDEIKRVKEEEEKRKAAEALKSAQDKARGIIRVTKLSTSNPNSAGGVDLFIGYINMSDKVIKYATFIVTPYNKVGDVATCEIRRHSTFRARDEGPHKKGEGLSGNYNWYWQNTWYNWTISKLVLNEIAIEYMDGTTVRLSGDDVKYVQY